MPKVNAKQKEFHKRTEADIHALLAAYDDDIAFGGGLYLRMQGGAARWFAVYRRRKQDDGKKVRHPLGTVEQRQGELHTLRAEAAQICEKARAGNYPDAPECGKAVPTFGEHATAFMDQYVPTLKNKSHQDKWRSSVTNHCKSIWNKPIDQIYKADVIAVLKPIWKTIPVMASEVRARMEAILDDAANHDLRNGDNPALWTKALMHSLGGAPPASGETRGSHAAVPFDEIPALMVELAERNCQTARALSAIILSCLRSQEFVGMRRCELDLDAEQPSWTVPYERFKVDPHKQDYVVPLAPQLVAILREQIAELDEIYGPDNVDYIWPGSISGTRGDGAKPVISSNTMLKYLKESMERDATVHGFRASFDTWTDDQFADGSDATPKYHPHAVEFVLAHVAPGGKTKKSYRRGMMLKARIAIMRDWADHCLPPKPAATKDNNVAAIADHRADDHDKKSRNYEAV